MKYRCILAAAAALALSACEDRDDFVPTEPNCTQAERDAGQCEPPDYDDGTKK